MWLLHGFRKRMYLFDDHGLPLPKAYLRAAAGPHRVDYEKPSSDLLGESHPVLFAPASRPPASGSGRVFRVLR
jgi:hypothetical protein